MGAALFQLCRVYVLYRRANFVGTICHVIIMAYIQFAWIQRICRFYLYRQGACFLPFFFIPIPGFSIAIGISCKTTATLAEIWMPEWIQGMSRFIDLFFIFRFIHSIFVNVKKLFPWVWKSSKFQSKKFLKPIRFIVSSHPETENFLKEIIFEISW